MRDNIPEDTSDQWMRHMRRGEFEEAWKINAAVLKARAGKPCWHLPRHFQYIWDGSSLAGKRVLVRCYHGLGDTIQFIRYAPLIREIATEVIVWAQPALLPLLKTMPAIDQLLPLHEGSPEVSYEVDVEVMELPAIFNTTVATIPRQIPYLQARPCSLPEFGKQLAVGLVWKAGDWDPCRSVPFPLLAPLAQLPGIRLYILQPDPVSAGWQEGLGIFPGNYSLEEYAGLMRAMDLVITVDTMAAHLAGALGVPVWTLLQARADWRWMENRHDSPWYPTMRLFRQQQPGDWEPVVAQVIRALSLETKPLSYALKK